MFRPEPDFDAGLVVDVHNRLSRKRRLTELSLGAMGWFLWFSLLRPSFVVLLWALGLHILHHHVIAKSTYNDSHLLASLGIGIVSIFLVVTGWNVYNRVRYGGKYKGRSPGLAENDYMGAFYRIPAEDVGYMKAGRRIDIHFRGGHVIDFDVDGGEMLVKGFYDPQSLAEYFREVLKLEAGQHAARDADRSVRGMDKMER